MENHQETIYRYIDTFVSLVLST